MLIMHVALYVQGNGANRAPWDNKIALRDLQRREALDLFGNQQELRDRNAATATATASTSTTLQNQTGATATDESFVPRDNGQGKAAPAATLERQTTAPLSNVTPHSAGGEKENSPSHQSLGPGFTRASQVVVTPGQQQQQEQASVAVGAVLQSTAFPHSTSSNSAHKASPPPRRFTPLNTQPSPATNSNQQQSQQKRQKVIHNPYQ